MYNQFFRMQRPGVTALESAKLKGPVAKVMLITYIPKLVDGLIHEGPVVDNHSTHDDINYILTFNEDGNLSHELVYGKLGEWKEEKYEGGNRSIERLEFRDWQLEQVVTSSYNSYGKALLILFKQGDGTLKSEFSHEYDDKGNMIKNIHDFHPNPAQSTITEYLFDEQGRHVGVDSYTKLDGKLTRRFRRIYNDKGLEVETITEDFEGKREGASYREVKSHNKYGDTIAVDTYDLKGQHLKTARYDEYYQYDAQGNRINRMVEAEEDQFTFQDKEDEHGNWVWRLVLEQEVPRFVMTRQIQYFNQPEQEMVHPLSVKKENAEDQSHRKVKSGMFMPLDDADMKFMYGQENLTPDQFPLHRYYAVTFKYPPSVRIFTGNIEANEVHRKCMNVFGAKQVFSYGTNHNGWRTMVRYTLSFPMYPGYLLQANHMQQVSSDHFIVPSTIDSFDDQLQTSQFWFLSPPEDSEFSNDYFEMWMTDLIDNCTLKKRPGKPKINMIEVRGNSFAMVERPVHDNFAIRDLDINYGQGFETFHNELMGRFNTSTKGLVLFHGLPGTGKTYYIRHLLRQMALAKKAVIYMPPNMVDHLTDPGFMTFLTTSVQNWSNEGQFCVLLIEDAEPLLAKRQEGVRIQGVTNLLNMTDGLLNDLLNLQIICTFNVDLRKLDSALLRPGRLLARKEFRPLSVLDANLLAQRLGIKQHFNKPASLGDIYAMLKDQNTLVHDVDPERNASNNIDDL